MATHTSNASMLKESLPEFIEASKFCVDYRKTDVKWVEFKTGGCLGYPGAVLLFSIIDSIGSYFKKNKNFKIKIDLKDVTIDSDGWEHFKILNSKYFKQNLSMSFIKALYTKFRSFLTHNSVIGSNSIMIMDNESLGIKGQNKAFFIGKNDKNESVYIISIKELWELCKNAVDLFVKDIDTVVPNSKQGKNIN